MELTRQWLDSTSDKVLNAFNEGVVPNDSIKKIVQDNDLNFEQTKRLCEQANLKIKKYLSATRESQNFSFPLADWKLILSNAEGPEGREEDMQEKTASLYHQPLASGADDEEWFGSIEKRASISPSISAKAASAVLLDLGDARRRIISERNERIDRLEKQAELLFSHLREECAKTGSVNLSYTIAKTLVPQRDHVVVDTLFKEAHSVLENNFRAPLPDPDIIKIAGKINPKSKFVSTLRDYISERRAVIKLAMAEFNLVASLERAKAKVNKRLLETEC